MPTFNIDGQLVNPEAANISVMDHGLLYGDGVFEGLRFYNKKLFCCPEHLRRLLDSGAAIGLELPMSGAAMTSAMLETIEASNQVNGYIRLIVTRGAGPLGIDSTECQNPRTIIIVDQLALVPNSLLHDGIRVVIAATRRFSADQLDPRIKSLNYLNQIMARREATSAGAHEAILLNQSGRVAEGSADNLFIVKEGVLMTPPVSEGALDGITRKVILQLASQANIAHRECPLTPLDLITADECFLTGTGAELIPVAKVGDHCLATKRPMFERLQSAFRNFVQLQTETAL
ncbi:MAG: branched-chain amino acid aminotransferase [Patiriisocius sp.]|jgi:branched-chain amino acid aminotransferase